MKIAVISEISGCDKNKDIIDALEERGHEIINTGMKNKDDEVELTYINTGLLAAILLNTGKVDLAVGGCGTGQGFLISAMQYPNVFCGHILTPLDAWLFAQINDGNCISLALNQGYGWAGEVNLKLLFDNYFGVVKGAGYPDNRKDSQALSRDMLKKISGQVHCPFENIINDIDSEILEPILQLPGLQEILDVDNINDIKIKKALMNRISDISI